MYDYKLLEKRLEDLTAYFADKLPEQNLSDIKEYIYHGEYGLAYEVLCYAIVELNQKVNPDTYENIVNLGQSMNIDKNIWIQINAG